MFAAKYLGSKAARGENKWAMWGLIQLVAEQF